MATNFNTNAISTNGGFKPSTTNTPLDIRSRVETEADIMSIPKPYIGMIIYVSDSGKRFEVLSLKDGKQGMTTIKNGFVNEYRELPYATREEVAGNLDGKVDKEEGKGLSSFDFTAELKAKLEALPSVEQISAMMEGKVDKDGDKGLSQEDFTTSLKTKLEELPTRREIESMIANAGGGSGEPGTGSGDCLFTDDMKNAIENELLSRVEHNETNISFFTRSGSSTKIEIMDSTDISTILDFIM